MYGAGGVPGTAYTPCTAFGAATSASPPVHVGTTTAASTCGVSGGALPIGASGDAELPEPPHATSAANHAKRCFMASSSASGMPRDLRPQRHRLAARRAAVLGAVGDVSALMRGELRAEHAAVLGADAGGEVGVAVVDRDVE